MGEVFGFLQPVLIPLIVAGIVAYVLDPVVRFLENRGMSRLWSVVTLFLVNPGGGHLAGRRRPARHPARPHGRA